MLFACWFVCFLVCAHTYTHISTSVHASYTHTYIHTYIHTIHTYTRHTHIHTKNVHTSNTYTHMNILSYIHGKIYTPHAHTHSQYGIYRTNIRIGGSGLLECIYRDPTKKVQNEIIGNITDLGSPDLLLLYSPGFLIDGVYPNQMVMIFNIQCPGGKQAYFNTTSLMVEQKCEGV